jgi:hypothetical protein
VAPRAVWKFPPGGGKGRACAEIHEAEFSICEYGLSAASRFREYSRR